MIKVSVMYANELGARFDHTYYRDKHMPLVQARLGDACKYYTIDKGHFSRQRRQYRRLCGDVSYLQCHIFSESVEAFETGLGPHAEEFNAAMRRAWLPSTSPWAPRRSSLLVSRSANSG
ncbi:EthD family reductase [Cupriavidus sp. D39]|uniref:EthD family reductase n=1 Tax=Cupriavidus sp. D39 TaxID=2997877 RepID=UPI002270CC60|nr:EthD family reductase [Cupriavidus sp. D39]MCY0854966.1 EthD family reductase [Cupriavidus sp. D39]